MGHQTREAIHALETKIDLAAGGISAIYSKLNDLQKAVQALQQGSIPPAPVPIPPPSSPTPLPDSVALNRAKFSTFPPPQHEMEQGEGVSPAKLDELRNLYTEVELKYGAMPSDIPTNDVALLAWCNEWGWNLDALSELNPDMFYTARAELQKRLRGMAADEE